MTVPFMLLPAGLVTDGRLDETRADLFEESLTEFVEQHLRSSDVETVEEASVQLAREFASAEGRQVDMADPARFNRWVRMATRLAAGTSSTTEGGIRRLLDSYAGKPQQVLDALARHPLAEPVPQRELRDRLGIEETYMSKIVSRLAEADLVAHWKSGRSGYLVATASGRRFATHPAGPGYATVAQRAAEIAAAVRGLLDEVEHDFAAPTPRRAFDIVAQSLTNNRVLDEDLASGFGDLLEAQAGRRI